jgi:small subunit ribosomal protein S20
MGCYNTFLSMASVLKRTRKNKKIRVRNRYYFKSIRTAIKKLEENRNNLDFAKTISMIDKLSKRRVIHKKKAGRMKKQLNNFLHNVCN